MSDSPPVVLIVDDEPAQRALLADAVKSQGYAVRTAASAEIALSEFDGEPPAMVLLDVRLPGISGIDALAELRRRGHQQPVLLITAHADLKQAIAAIKGGADDYLAKPIDLDELASALHDMIGPADRRLPRAASASRTMPPWFIAESPAMRALASSVEVVARSPVHVLVTGESGVGKEVVARLLHEWSPQCGGPLIMANCGGFAESLIESELFGHVVGAFTGATHMRQGLFRSASGGTLFLDEIGELPIQLQPLLLRALEAKQVTPVGSDSPAAVDVRLVAATNRNLEEAIAAGRFREDLFYRINVVDLLVPPLRERCDDILPLARRFAAEFAGGPIRLSPQATRCLLAYRWPGNVRELRNAIQRSCLLSRGDVILPEHLSAKIADACGPAPAGDSPESGRLSQVERATILATLEETGGNRTHAAKKLGISRRTLIYKLRAMKEEMP